MLRKNEYGKGRIPEPNQVAPIPEFYFCKIKVSQLCGVLNYSPGRRKPWEWQRKVGISVFPAGSGGWVLNSLWPLGIPWSF